MGNRTGRKVVKFHKEYLITIDVKTDTVFPDEVPLDIRTFDTILRAIVNTTNDNKKSTNVTLKER